MTLIVEDGTGVAGAESYISVADADTYFTLRGNTAWAALAVPAKEAALRAGCDYLEARYAWRGGRATTTQALSWPRVCVVVDGAPVDPASVPLAVARANAELAVRASTAPLLSDESAQVTRETVGPLTVEYQPGGRQNPRFAAVEAMLGAYVLGAGGAAVLRA